MLNYIRAEFYKVSRRKYTWITLAVMLALEAVLVGGFVFMNAHGSQEYFYTGAMIVLTMLSVGFWATLLTGDMVFAEQYKNATLKNEVSYGLSRTRIYLGKLIVQTILSILFCVVMLGFYLGLCWVLLYHDPAADAAMAKQVGYCLAVAFPLWIGGQGVTCAMFFLIRSERIGTFAMLGIVGMLPNVIWVASAMVGEGLGDALMTVYKYMPSVMADASANMGMDWTYCGKAWIVGAVWLICFTALGLWGFQKKEIK